jgi:hypothetical protein
MEKNWLIRTKSNHILGPISKEKVLELYHNGSIKADDEVCTGNGYWFFIREDDLVQRYLLGNETQNFNPISEAKDVLTASATEDASERPVEDDVTLIGGIDLSMLNAPVESSAALTPEKETDIPEPQLVKTVPTENKKKLKIENQPSLSVSPPGPKKKPLKKQNYLQYIVVLGFALLFLMIYFRKTIIRHIFQGEVSSRQFNLFNAAYAQESSPEKKKSF